MTTTLMARALALSVAVHALVLALPWAATWDMREAPATGALAITLVAPAVRRAHTATAAARPAMARDENPAAETLTTEARPARADGNAKPPYPLAARRRGIEGTVRLRVYVHADGRCHEAQIVASSGSALLDDSARSTVCQWRFVPAIRAGQPVASWVEIPVRFRLEQAEGAV